ncbi:MAG: anti-CBASS protein Acb1 family protein [Planctomycetota bacterium]|jgi:hypothetical protein
MVLGRIKRIFRSEVQQTYDGTTDETAPSDFVSDLVSGEYNNRDLWQHQLKVMWEDPLAHRNTVLLAHNVFDDWFVIKTLKKTEEEEELVEHPKNKQIQEELTSMNAKYHFTQALIYERGFGRSFLVFNFNKHRADVIREGFQIAELDVFTEENTKIPLQAYGNAEANPTGEPMYIIVTANAVWGHTKDEIPWEQVQMWCTRPKGRSYEGYSANEAAWNDMAYSREIVDAIAWMIKKLGLGAWIWWVKGGLSTELKDAMEDTYKNMSGKRVVVTETETMDRMEWSGPPSTGAASAVEILDWLLGEISSATGTPKDVYTGVSAGAITGSEINNKALFATISKIQSDITPYVLDTIRRMGYDIDDMVIEFNTRYATDELEQAQIALLKAQAEQLLAQTEQTKKMTEQGRGPLDMAIGAEPTSQKDQTKTQNITGVQSQ